jgi:hypothetical protein
LNTTTEYNLALFLHVVGVLGLAAAYTFDTAGCRPYTSGHGTVTTATRTGHYRAASVAGHR